MRRMYSENQLLKVVEEKADEKGISIFENIVDKDGHLRYVEGTITYPTTTGITQDYGKWALSGSHLLLVLCLTFEESESAYTSKNATIDNVPLWIKQKIKRLFGDAVDYKSVSAFDSQGNNQSMNCYLRKSANDEGDSAYFRIQIGTITPTSTKSARFSFDLLIDNE